MAIPLTYTGLTTALYDLLQTTSADANFANILPSIINDAEQRIYREVDFLNNREADSTLPVTVNSRNFTIPSEIIVVETPAILDPVTGARTPLLRISVDAINMIWPQSTGQAAQGAPVYYAMLSDAAMILAPTPDQAYVMEVTGVFRPQPISSTNTSTYLSTNFPDLFLAACMVFASGYQRDFGQQSDNPQMAMSWEALYQARLASVKDEEARRRGLKPEGP